MEKSWKFNKISEYLCQKNHRGLENIVHKIGLNILLGWVLFLPITAYSLGLGDIDVKSFLNQPLKAEISIISVRPGEIDDLLVGLASRSAFSRASLSRPSHLSDLKFKVIKSEDGESAVISVKTQTAVKEPVLNFLVEADWSKGKVFREFTILLDPPYFAQQYSKPASKPTPKANVKTTPPQSVAETTQALETEEQSVPIVNQAPSQNEAAVSDDNNDGYVNESAITEEYNFDVSSVEAVAIQKEELAAAGTMDSSSPDSITISDGATLWSVAKTLKSDGMSMSQVMLALQRINQEAFGKGNINNLKQGSVLRVPTQQDMAELSQRDAYVEVLNQNGLWNDYLASIGHASADVSNTQANGSNNSSSDAEQETSNSELSIVTADEGSSDKAALRSDEDMEQVSTLRKQLLLSEEESESLKVERDELSARVQMLESELERRNDLDSLVAIEDDNLASMEQALADEKDNTESTVAMPDTTMPEETASDTPVINEEPTIVVENEQESDLTTAAVQNETAQPIETESTPAVQTPDIQTPVIQTPIIVSETNSPSGGLVDDILQAVMSNTIVQGVIAGILIFTLLVVKFLKGRKQKQPKEDESESIEDVLSEDPIDTQSGIIIPNVDDEDETPINVPQMEANQPVDDFASTMSNLPSAEGGDEDEDEFSKTAIISANDMAAMESVAEPEEAESDEQDETLDEVDVYLAYSLFDNAEELLKQKLDESPDRADYRAKLLDTYFATQNKDSFNDEASSLKSLGEKAAKYWPRIQTMGFELDPSNPMFAEGEGGDISDLAIEKPEMADFDIGSEESEEAPMSDFDLSLDGDDTNFDLSEDNGGDDGGLEFNLDDDLPDESINDSDSNDELPDDLGGLDFDFDDPIVEPEEEPELETSNKDGGLDFDLDDDILDVDSSESKEIEDTAVIDDALDIGEDGLDFTIDEEDELDIGIDDIDSEIDLTSEIDSGFEIDLSSEVDSDIEIDELDVKVESDDFESTGIMDAPNLSQEDEAVVLLDEDDTEMLLDEDDAILIDDSDSNISLDDEMLLDVSEDLDEMQDTVAIAADDMPNIEEDSNSNDEEVLDISLDEGISLDIDEDDVSDSFDIGIEEDELADIVSDVDETMVLSAADIEADVAAIEKTEIVSALENEEDELVIPDVDIDLDLDLDLDEEDITDIGNIEGLMLPDDVDEVATKLDLAKAFYDMGDSEGARSSLEEVVLEGSEEQMAEAKALLDEMAD